MLSVKVMEGTGPGLTRLSRRVEEGTAVQVRLGGDNTSGRREETSQEGFLCQHRERLLHLRWLGWVVQDLPSALFSSPPGSTWTTPTHMLEGSPRGMALLLVLLRPLAMILS